MRNYLYIHNNIVVAVVEKDGPADSSVDYEYAYDTIAEDDSRTFSVGDEFSAELQLEKNKEIWKEKGLMVEVEEDVQPEILSFEERLALLGVVLPTKETKG